MENNNTNKNIKIKIQYSGKMLLFAALGLLSAVSCIYTDAMGVVPAGAVSGKEAISRIRKAAILGAQLSAQKIESVIGVKYITDAVTVNGALWNGEAAIGLNNLQPDRNYRPAGLADCEFALLVAAPFIQEAIFKQYYSSTDFSTLQNASNLASEAAFVYSQENCSIEATGRVVDLGPVSF